MRKLMWFTIGFTAACTINAYLGLALWLFLLIMACTACLFYFRKHIAAWILTGAMIGMLWCAVYNHFYLNIAKDYDYDVVNTSITVSDYSYETDYGVAVEGKITLDGKTFRTKLYYPGKTELRPGDRITGEIRLRLTTDDAIKGGTHHQGDGIFLLSYLDETAKIVSNRVNNWKYFGAHLRNEFSGLLKKAMPADTLGFATALFLGDTSLLDYKTDTDFKLSGIRHIVAVSGLHISILMSVVYIITAKKRYLSALIGIPVLFVFAAIVGFTPSVVRACIMQGLMLLALALNKEYDPPTALSFAVLSMLCVSPMTILSVGFQLSCGCIVGIFLFYQKINEYLLKLLKAPEKKCLKRKLLCWFTGSVSITLSTMVVTTPLSAAYFGTVSIVGVLTNLLTLWVIAFIFCGIGLACLGGVIWLPLAKGIGWVISIPTRYVLLMAKWMAAPPFAAVYTCSSYIVIWLVLSYLLLAVYLITRHKYPMLMCGGVVLTLLLAVFLSWCTPAGENYAVTVFDVGQGQSILFEVGNERYLVDCGGDSGNEAANTVCENLLSRGITRLDGIFVTHYDKDHVGGIIQLMSRIQTDTLYLPDIVDEGVFRKKLEKAHKNIYWIDSLETIEMMDADFTVIPGEHPKDDNERSLCILFQTENCDILITGDRGADGEKALLAQVALPKLELLVAGHHGSASSTGLELLAATKPEKAIISVGKNNYHGHPAKIVLRRLELFECSIWRTDMDGTVVFKG